MSHTPHELAADFPEHADPIHDLRGTDAHFARLCDTYHDLNRSVHAAETDVSPTSDEHLAHMRKERMTLKDQIYAYLKSA